MASTKPDPLDAAAAGKADPDQKEPLVERMFSGFLHATVPQSPPQPPLEEPYRPLHQVKADAGVIYRLQTATRELHVQASSPATDVMTDLSRVEAVTTPAGATVDEAHQTMIENGVRALFVVDEGRVVLGIVTANDILGERPIQIAHDRGVRHGEVLVSGVMTPAEQLEVMDLRDVLTVRVGDVVETLKRSGRQHAMVIESAPADSTPSTWTVRGIFSLTQIARQLGLQPQIGQGVARTFAEIEAAIGA